MSNTETTPQKGEFNGECNRTACTNERAVFYNYSTQKYYCPACAKTINQYNYADAMRLYGHDLCLLSTQFEDPRLKKSKDD